MELEAVIDCQHTLKCLQRAGINSVEQLVICTHEDIMAIHGIGSKIAEYLEEIIERESASNTIAANQV